MKRESLVKEIAKNRKLIDNLKIQLPVILDKLDIDNREDSNDP